MKKLICIMLTIALCLSLGGCSVKKWFDKNIKENIEKYINTEIFSGELVEGDILNAKKLEPTEISAEEKNRLRCYEAITDEQKRIYDILYTAAYEMTEGWINLGFCGSDFRFDVTVAYQALCNDNPQFFWLNTNYLLSNAGSQKTPEVLIAFSVNEDDYSCSYLLSKDAREDMETVLMSRVKKIASEAEGLTPYQAELYFHDAICERVVYTNGEAEDLVYTAYGALINGKAVCEGYARAMQLLCNAAGIPCTVIIGYSQGEGHMWNLVNPGNGWYHVDVTWDDSKEEKIQYLYFNLTDTQIEFDHTISPDFSVAKTSGSADSFNIGKYKCDNQDLNYFVHENLIYGKNYATEVATRIIISDKNGLNEQQFLFESDSVAKSFDKNYNKQIQKIQDNIDSGYGITINNIAYTDRYVIIYW